MKITEIVYRYTEPTLAFGNQSFELKAELEEGDNEDEALKAMEKIVFLQLQTDPAKELFYNYILKRKAQAEKKKEGENNGDTKQDEANKKGMENDEK